MAPGHASGAPNAANLGGVLSDPCLTALIPSMLDDAGLTAQEFRAYCHIARRGECFGSLDTMASHCRMNRDTLMAAIRELIERNMVVRESRPGATSVYRVAAISDWKQPGGKEGLAENRGQPLESSTGQRKVGASHLEENRGHKGYPIEGSPLKGIPKGVVVPLLLNTPEFKTAWELWLEYRRSRRQPFTEQSQRLLLEEFAGCSPGCGLLRR